MNWMYKDIPLLSKDTLRVGDYLCRADDVASQFTTYVVKSVGEKGICFADTQGAATLTYDQANTRNFLALRASRSSLEIVAASNGLNESICSLVGRFVAPASVK